MQEPQQSWSAARRRLRVSTWRGLWVLVLGLGLLVGWGWRDVSQSAPATPGWGSEVLTALPGAAMDALIPPANACGLGASSCFKCHNGQRAAKANMDPAAAPWHAEHEKINNSCVGCHQGNPRLMREAMAHKGMLESVLAQPEEGCAGCHKKPDELKSFVEAYAAVPGGKE